MSIRFTCEVETPDGVVRFVLDSWRSSSEDDRTIEPEFYVDYCADGQIPQGPHHEVEILEPAKIGGHEHEEVIHYHINRGGGQFVCWTGSLPSLSAVSTMLRVWCAGTAFTMATGKDFTVEFEGDFDQIVRGLSEAGYKVVLCRNDLQQFEISMTFSHNVTWSAFSSPLVKEIVARLPREQEDVLRAVVEHLRSRTPHENGAIEDSLMVAWGVFCQRLRGNLDLSEPIATPLAIGDLSGWVLWAEESANMC